jgi:thymidylate synthase (FAD)|tara:strand:- start:1578 stop:2246 length:669 start_codon:yes stop_codon:yes gene_type:complete
MTVDLITHMGSDLTVVNAARVSFDKESNWEGIPFAGEIEGMLSEKDEKLIKYLARHKHWTPFGHCFAQFRITAPVFVARQLIKHQIGLVWNEVSRRYVDTEPEFWEPDVWRGKAKNKKQGSELDGVASQDVMKHVYNDALRHARDAYNYLLQSKVCPEQARAILPQSLITQWYWSGSLAAFARVCNLRNKPDAQIETQLIAKEINNHMKELFPNSWSALCGT